MNIFKKFRINLSTWKQINIYFIQFKIFTWELQWKEKTLKRPWKENRWKEGRLSIGDILSRIFFPRFYSPKANVWSTLNTWIVDNQPDMACPDSELV